MLVHNTFVFSKDLQAFGYWYRQLVGESIGKKYDRSGAVVEVGIIPTVTVGSTDLHSLAQLYLSGPRIVSTTFLSVKASKTTVSLPVYPEFDDFVVNIQGKTVFSIISAIMNGIKVAYKNDNRPYMQVVLPDKTAKSIGQLLQWKMVEIIYLGYLLEVNPFDQPQVELYKTETRKILARE
jgi:glucose-6-phosphate isomerase